MTNKPTKPTLESLDFTPHEEIRETIEKKLGVDVPQLPADLPAGDWSDQAQKVLKERYLQKDAQGETSETPDEMCWRVAWEVASAELLWKGTKKRVEQYAREFYQLLVSHVFLPNSPTLMNAGTKNRLQYSACFVLPVGDSLIDIFDAVKYQAIIHQSGGGTGFSFSRLRPRGAIVGSSRGTASGPVSFMRVFDAATNEIKQGGKRRGANMGILRVDHPDILEFIHSKTKGGITNFNISVGITDTFIKAYKRGEEYDLIDPRTSDVVESLNAREVFESIAQCAHKTGDPGVIFIDRINSSSANPVPSLGPIESTNPCGEQPLYPFDSCNLGSIFLPYLLTNNQGKREINWDRLRDTVQLAIHFMDNVIEMNPYPLAQIRQTSLAIRRIGLGIGGWADLLVDLELPYDSEEALKLGEKIMKTIQEEATLASQKLAKDRGPFPLWSSSIYQKEPPRRNATVTTIAPTGSISIIADTSSGIEPLFAIAYQHIVKDEHLSRTLTFVNPRFKKIAIERGFWSDQIEKLVAERGTIRDLPEIPEDVRRIFATAHEIDFEWHIKMQAAFQKYTENAVSKTINLRHEVKVDDVTSAYLLAYELKCQGITVFRDGCKDVQVLNLGVKKDAAESSSESAIPWVRPSVMTGATHKIKTPVGTAFITVNTDEQDNPIEVFINIGRAGSDVQAMAEALGRLISKSLKFGSHLTARERAVIIIDQLKGIGGRRSVGFGPNRIRSLPDAVAVALSHQIGLPLNGNGLAKATSADSNGHVTSAAEENLPAAPNGADHYAAPPAQYAQAPEPVGDICPACGAGALVYEEGCVKCHACGHSEC